MHGVAVCSDIFRLTISGCVREIFAIKSAEKSLKAARKSAVMSVVLLFGLVDIARRLHAVCTNLCTYPSPITYPDDSDGLKEL